MSGGRAAFPGAPLLALTLSGCDGPQAVLDPHGYSATVVADLWWVMLALGALVWIVVVALAVYVLFVRRAPPSDRPIALRTEGDGKRAFWVAAGAGLSLLILIGVFGYSLATGRALQRMAAPEPLTIEVIGRQWWWEVRYEDPDPARRFVTANELRVPVGVPVLVKLTSADVIHSFWVPNLTGKMDLVPGRTNTLWIRADDEGIYRGQCAEFCGLQHANMAFMVQAHAPAEFEAWVEGQIRPAEPPSGPERQAGEQVFMTSGCVLCHTVRGTRAGGTLGPDLTHLASRLSLAAGMIPNTRGHLGGWIANPQVLKPGNRMPRVELDAEELQALLAYLEGLH